MSLAPILEFFFRIFSSPRRIALIINLLFVTHIFQRWQHHSRIFNTPITIAPRIILKTNKEAALPAER